MIDPRSRTIRSMRAVVGPAAVLTAFFAGGLAFGFGGLHSVADALVFTGYVALVVVGAGSVAAMALDALGLGTRSVRFAAWGVALATMAGLVVVFMRRPFWLGRAGDATSLAASVGAAWLAAWLLTRREPAGRTSPATRLSFCVAVALVPPLAGALLHRPPRELEVAVAMRVDRPPVLVFGVDGATWDVLDGVVARGGAPEFDELRKRGNFAPFRSEIALAQPLADTASVGMRTAVLWETLATGRRPEVHGVWDFLQSRLPGMRRALPFRVPLRVPFVGDATRSWLHEEPVGSRSGDAPRIWEVASQLGVGSRIVGWHSTWPALPDPPTASAAPGDGALAHSVYREVVSDEAHVLGGPGAHATWPREVDTHLPPRPPLVTQGLKRRDALSLSDLLFEVTGVRADLSPSSPDEPAVRDNLIRLALDLARDRFYVESLERRVRERPGAEPLTAVYIRAVDTAQHLFWQFYQPDLFPGVDPAAARRLGDVIPAAYREADRLLARARAALPADTAVIVVSDHGAGPWLERAGIFGRGGSEKFAAYSGNHRLFGIWIAAGQPFAAGATPRDPTVYDLAPTLAHLLGLPVSSELTGRVLDETFVGEWSRTHAVRASPGWGRRVIPPLGDVGEGADDEYKARLKALGYL